MAERERRLTLPDRQRIRRDERVAELKAKDTKLGEMRVADGELGLILADVVEGNVLVLGFLVMDDGVPLGERSSLDILTGDSDVLLLEREGSERERLGSRPVDVRALGDGLASGLEDSSEVLVRGEAVGEGGDDLSDLLEHRLVRSRRLGGNDVLGELLGSGESVPGRGEPLLGRGLVVLGALVGLLEHAPDPFLVLLDVLLGKGALLDEPVNVLGEDGRLGGDGLVHPRLGERRLIGLVVTVLSVADDVDDDVLLELGPPVGGELADKVDGLDVVSVDVEDGGVDRLGDVGAVGRRTGESGVCRETNLVVDDDVDGSSGSVVGERVHAHRLVDDSLTGERSVSVEKNTHSGVVVDLVSLKVLDGSGLTQNDGVLALEMGRIGDERERNLLPGRRRSDVVGAEVVLDVTSSRVVGVSRSLAVRVRGNKETREYKSGEERKKTVSGRDRDNRLGNSAQVRQRSTYNSLRMASIGFLTTLARTFNLPRCGIPNTMAFVPASTLLSINAFIPGMRLSQPSRPNLFSFGNLEAMKFSKPSDHMSRSRIIRFSSTVYFQG
jgi:hypothetical protein